MIYDRYWKRVFRVSERYLQSSDLAQDIVQEVFVALWDKRMNYTDIQNLEAYLVTMTQNLTYKAMRRWTYEARKNEEYLSNIQQVVEGGDLAVISNQYDDLLREAVALLPTKQRQVFQLVRNEGLSHEEVAAQLNISLSAVKKNMVRALLFIRNYLAPYLVPSVFLMSFLALQY